MRKVDADPSYNFVFESPEETGKPTYQLAMVTPKRKVILPLKSGDSLFMTIDFERVNYRTGRSALAFIRKAITFWQKLKKAFKPVDQIPGTEVDVLELIFHLDQLVRDAREIRKLLQRRINEIRRRRKSKHKVIQRRKGWNGRN